MDNGSETLAHGDNAKHHPPAISIEPPVNGDEKLNGDLDSPSAELTPSQVQELFRQAQASPSSSSVAGSTRQQYQPAKCNEEKIKKLLENSPFTILNENGQRRYCQPGLKDQAPPKGCEVFIGKLPPDCFEDELVPLLERVGKLRELRIMMEYSGTNRGYCFATYESRDSAKQSVREFNNYEIRKGKTLGVCLSVDNCRLFVGGIPKSKLKEDVYAEMKQLTEGVVDVIMYPSASDKTKNRGFAFVEYESHRSAAVARKKLMNGKAQLWGHQIAVDWAEPERFVDEDVMATVKILYVRNLMLSTTEEKLREVFSAVCSKPDGVERVKKIRDYAFVHFRDRADALKCRDALNNTHLEGTMIEVCLAKPVDKSERQSQTNANTAALHGTGLINTGLVSPLVSPTLPMYYDPTLFAMTAGLPLPAQVLGLPPVSPTLIDSAKLLAMQNALAAGHQAMMANANSGATMQNETRLAPGMKRRQQSGRTAAGGRSYSASLASQQNTQRKPVEGKVARQADQTVASDPQSSIAANQLNALITSTAVLPFRKSSVQLLEEFCQKHGFGNPVYNLHTAISHEGVDLQMYLFKISIPLTGVTFTPNRLCVNVEEARQFAAEFVLQQLTQQTPLMGTYETPLVSPSNDVRMTLPNPLLGNVGGIFPQLPLQQIVPTIPPATMTPYLLPPNVTPSHPTAQSNQQVNVQAAQGGRPVDGTQAQHANYVVQQPPRFDGNAPQYYDANMTVANGAYFQQQPMMQPGPQANVAY